jgi:hypothetical protein
MAAVSAVIAGAAMIGFLKQSGCSVAATAASPLRPLRDNFSELENGERISPRPMRIRPVGLMEAGFYKDLIGKRSCHTQHLFRAWAA